MNFSFTGMRMERKKVAHRVRHHTNMINCNINGIVQQQQERVNKHHMQQLGKRLILRVVLYKK